MDSSDDVGESSSSDAVAAFVAPTVPRLDLSSLGEGNRQSLTQIAMKSALEGQIRGVAGIDVGETTSMTTMPTPEISVLQEPLITLAEEAQGPSTPTSARAAPVEMDVCTICTGNLGENGGTLSLLCGKKEEEKREMLQTDGR